MFPPLVLLKQAGPGAVSANGLAGHNGYVIPNRMQHMGGGGGGAGGTVANKMGSTTHSFKPSVNGGAGGSGLTGHRQCDIAGHGGSGGKGAVVEL